MRISTHGNYLTQLTRYTAFNNFLLREDEGFTLIDTGLKGSGKAIIKAASELGAPIRRIVLTHAHLDHVAALDELVALLPDVEVMISGRDARFLAGDMSLDADEPQMRLKGSYQVTQTRPTRLLKDGDRIGSLEVIATPGHTPGHIALFDHRDRTLIAGDAFSTKAGIVTGGTLRLLFPFPALATWHKALATRSAERLVKLQPSRLAVGHGHVIEDPLDDMRRAIEVARRKLGPEAFVGQSQMG